MGKKAGLPIVFASLRKLEYRGYDSSGVAFFAKVNANSENTNASYAKIEVIKAVGKLDNLKKALIGKKSLPLTAIIGHSRWATHGIPNEINAHPHFDCQKKIFLVHNGIIENYKNLKEELAKRGHKFRSQTDTEILAHLIENEIPAPEKSLTASGPSPFLPAGRQVQKGERSLGEKIADYNFQALKKALKKIVGAYALAIIFKNEPEKIYIARLGSPLVVGLGKEEVYVASDATALAGLVKKVIYLKDGQYGSLSVRQSGKEPELETIIKPRPAKIESLDINPEQAKKNGFPRFMLKEIFEGPEIVEASLRGRLILPQSSKNGNKSPLYRFGGIKLGGLENVGKKLRQIKKLEIIACGTSYYAGMIGKMLFEEIAHLPTEVLLASEYRYNHSPAQKNTAAIFISQSGETADTLAALRKAKSRKYLTLGIVNVVGSSIARETVAGVYNHAGPEIGVASTKAFLSQLAVLSLMSLYLKPSPKNRGLIKELSQIPNKIKKVLKQNNQIKALAKRYLNYNNFLYLGRGYNYPSALEGALKIKEISYAHAEGYAGGEIKHGPIALIDQNFPAVVIATQNNAYEKMLSNIEEIKARGGPILAIASEGDKTIKQLANNAIYIPKTLKQFEPMLNVVALQLFAYHFGTLRGHNVDQPRNLAKSVTVE